MPELGWRRLRLSHQQALQGLISELTFVVGLILEEKLGNEAVCSRGCLYRQSLAWVASIL